MKNSRYFPFERNRYFYGKLLTVRDFESEQTYFNDKRRLNNRLLFGCGVVSGLQVVPIDEKSISVESGVALDRLGREIVVSSPVTLKLSMVEGFSNNEYAKNVYLCIAYDEHGKEPVHSVANSSVRSDEISEYNRILESYRLFIREEAPDPASFEHFALYEDIQVLYEDDQVRVLQHVPRYVNPGQVFAITLKVEKTLQTERVVFEYEWDAEHFTPVHGVEDGIVRFSEPADGRETEYEMKIVVRAGEQPREQVEIAMKPGTAKLLIGDKPVTVDSVSVNRINIIHEPIAQRLVKDYYGRTLDAALASDPDQCIYLAKISLLQMGPTYVIDKVEPVPYGEYVYSPALLYRLINLERHAGLPADFTVLSEMELLEPEAQPNIQVDYDKNTSELSFKLGLPRPDIMSDDINTGVVELSLDEASKSSGIFNRLEHSVVSEEIAHGFGPGDVFVSVGIEEKDDNDKVSDILNMSDRTYFGDESVFRGSEFEPSSAQLSIGSVLYPKRGTFRIGIKWEGRGETSRVRLRWWAIKKKLPGQEQLQRIEQEAAAANSDEASFSDEE